jgi:hypothetical protein
MGRNVHIKIGGGAPTTLENWEGIDFSDLKEAVADGAFDNQKVIIRGVQGDLVNDSDQIPLEGEVYIFATPAKMNAGK